MPRAGPISVHHCRRAVNVVLVLSGVVLIGEFVEVRNQHARNVGPQFVAISATPHARIKRVQHTVISAQVKDRLSRGIGVLEGSIRGRNGIGEAVRWRAYIGRTRIDGIAQRVLAVAIQSAFAGGLSAHEIYDTGPVVDDSVTSGTDRNMHCDSLLVGEQARLAHPCSVAVNEL